MVTLAFRLVRALWMDQGELTIEPVGRSGTRHLAFRAGAAASLLHRLGFDYLLDEGLTLSRELPVHRAKIKGVIHVEYSHGQSAVCGTDFLNQSVLDQVFDQDFVTAVDCNYRIYALADEVRYHATLHVAVPTSQYGQVVFIRPHAQGVNFAIRDPSVTNCAQKNKVLRCVVCGGGIINDVMDL